MDKTEKPKLNNALVKIGERIILIGEGNYQKGIDRLLRVSKYNDLVWNINPKTGEVDLMPRVFATNPIIIKSSPKELSERLEPEIIQTARGVARFLEANSQNIEHVSDEEVKKYFATDENEIE